MNWHQSGWDATSKYCQPTETEARPDCKPAADGQVPYGSLPLGPYTSRLSTRPALRSYYANGKTPPLDAVKAVIKQFVIHHDGCSTADMCWNVLQNERGLSCHFLLDNDGTIFQTCDLALMAYHASEWNLASIGVELCNRGDAKKEPTYYSKHGIKRDVKPCKINGHTILSYDYTPAQYDAFIRLARALTRLLPNLPVEYPQSSPGVQSWETLPLASTFSFAGYIGHYHLTNQKWDPGPFDFKDFARKLRGAFCFPMFPKIVAGATPDAQPTIPEQASDLKAATDELYKANEQRADGGFFPVGPWGEHRLWHGGVHLATRELAPVFSPFPGRLVAARMGPSSTVGSTNFLLMRHDMSLGKSKVQFYSLYMHLADEVAQKPQAAWVASDAWKKLAKSGQTVLLDEPIEAGTVIGHVGKAGPEELSKAQLHLEFFSIAELFADHPSSPWRLVDGTAGGRFCDSPEINDLIDGNKDGLLSRQELSAFYSGAGGAGTRYLVTLHVSEWAPEPRWSEALRVPKDFKGLKPADIDAMVAEQITPNLWWTPEVAQHCRLPLDGVVHHYHPVSFVGWFNQELLDAAALAAGSGKDKIDINDAREVPPGITDDREGAGMLSASEVTEDPCNQKLTLQEMVLGFDAPECGPQ
ncbi:MAG: N-acetylmuramoyl-L-alanine amidase [Deltaproteobacteria bacterium]|nr:N-acetylmuramoyl-L-alanine amidase [Deltaproteobacteria bacterium]